MNQSSWCETMVKSYQVSEQLRERENRNDGEAGERSDSNHAVLTKYPIIGGPGTRLPIFVESFLGWSLCLSCLAVSGYHFIKSTLLSSGSKYLGLCLYRKAFRHLKRIFVMTLANDTTDHKSKILIPYQGNDDPWIPLTTHSRAELERQSPWERYQSLLRLLEMKYPEVLTTPPPEVQGIMNDRNKLEVDMNAADAALIRTFRRDTICRRLASLSMRPYDPTKFAVLPSSIEKCDSLITKTTTLMKQLPHNQLLQRMSKYWNHFLALPSLAEVTSFCHIHSSSVFPVASSHNLIRDQNNRYTHRISLIVPAFHENGSHLLTKLTRALEMAQDPNEVEVIIVDSGGCTDLEILLRLSGRDAEGSKSNHYWGKISIFSYTSGGGRGPCLNFGASVAKGRILTFCHSDTMLPELWDKKIVSTLESGIANSVESSSTKACRANSCAFAFGIDTSREGLSMPFDNANTLYYPPGVKAVEFTANMRTRLYSLPYGDQVLSLHSCVFHFLGGFPDQCLMEDYELVSLLRCRAALFTSPPELSTDSPKENLAIIPGQPALCSPRRWQKFGVLYVTYMNSTFVNLYAGASRLGPDELFHQYYGKAPPMRDADQSPWELALESMLAG